jgi:hypothetical protein
MDDSILRDTLLEVIESSLDAQLRAVRRLRSSASAKAPRTSKEGMSQIDMAFNILSDGPPLHVNEIIAGIQKHFGLQVDRESLVSALSKRVARGDRFRRAGKNTFALLAGPQA